MIIDIAHHPDGGCWISDDRVNAFISSKAGGIAEIGFHGLQPVSRNSRMLVLPEGLLTVSLSTSRDIPFPFNEIRWMPGSIQTVIHDSEDEHTLRIEASCRSVLVVVTGPRESNATIVIHYALASLFTGVHGLRTWNEPLLRNHRVQLECRDRIMLHDWIRREGPYAGDFLIPEPLRRMIFGRQCRSGLATLNDLRPEYRDADIPLYDARTWLRIGGKGFSATRNGDDVVFTARMSGGERNQCTFQIDCAEDPVLFSSHEPGAGCIPAGREYPKTQGSTSPVLEWEGHPQVENFFRTVPDIVRSCVVRDIGMTRATPGAYYWIWSWDTMVTAFEMLRWGDNSIAGRIIRFINSHRDTDGGIPGRWTRSYQPLDTPQAGALEFLLFLLATNNMYETGEDRDILDVFPYAVNLLRGILDRCNDNGLTRNIGFYPDLPLQFGRTEQSVVALETGATYAFCRLLEVVARKSGDMATVVEAEELAKRIHQAFGPTFWDEKECFLRDSIDLDTGIVNHSYPLFSLLFLQTPLGFPLIRPFIQPMAKFAITQFQTPYGTALLAPWDQRRGNEDALSSWYPHWDVYLLKLLRRARERGGIMTWLQSVESVLTRLGYAPEFLALDRFSADSPDAWRRHGAYSNLNCATGWYRAIIEGLFGIEFDPGGITIIPLDLPLPPIAVHGLTHRGSAWNIRVENAGGSTAAIRVDGEKLRGCTKIPSRFHDRKPHRLDVTYCAEEAPPLFTELVNAEVLESSGDEVGSTVSIRALGTVDVAFPLFDSLILAVDGIRVPFSSDGKTHMGYTQLPIYGKHLLSLSKHQPS